jgi:hypothetical protein
MKVLPRRRQEENLNLLEGKAEDVPLRLMLKKDGADPTGATYRFSTMNIRNESALSWDHVSETRKRRSR